MPDSSPKDHGSVLFIDDDTSLRRIMKSEIARMGFGVEVAANVGEARRALGRQDFDVVILDLRMPKVRGGDYLEELKSKSPWSEVIVLTGHANVEVAIECMKKGAYDFLTKPCSLDQLETLLHKALEKRALSTQCRSLKRRSMPTGGLGSSPGYEKILDAARLVAPLDDPVLILGESGTGKELLAQQIVADSRRPDKPFITVNCSALTETLLESELFGHERGAFTGAESKRVGVFQLADRGTLFLDEVGDMPPRMQAKLLRTLQSGEVQPVGSDRRVYVDVRLISATNRDLSALVEDGTFRRDLFYRLNTFSLLLPPLRERGDDLVELVDHFLEEQHRRLGRTFRLAPATLERLKAYGWPGNIRELENVIKRAVVMAKGELVEPAALPEHIEFQSPRSAAGIDITHMTSDQLDELHIVKMIETCGGNKREAARQLGISSKTLYNKLHAYGIDLDSLAPTSET